MLAWVSFERFSPRKLTSGLRPCGGSVSIRGAAVLGLEALHRGPGLDQRAINREVLIRQQPLHAWERQKSGQKPGGDVAFEQPVAVLGEGGRVPDRIVDAEPDKPAEQEIVIQPLHQQALGADRVERLQEHRPQQPLRRDRGPARRRRRDPQRPDPGRPARHPPACGWFSGDDLDGSASPDRHRRTKTHSDDRTRASGTPPLDPCV